MSTEQPAPEPPPRGHKGPGDTASPMLTSPAQGGPRRFVAEPPVPTLLGRTQRHLCPPCPRHSSSTPAHPKHCREAPSGTPPPPPPVPAHSSTCHRCGGQCHPRASTLLSTQPSARHCLWALPAVGGGPRSLPSMPRRPAHCSHHATREHLASRSSGLWEQHQGAGSRSKPGLLERPVEGCRELGRCLHAACAGCAVSCQRVPHCPGTAAACLCAASLLPAPCPR